MLVPFSPPPGLNSDDTTLAAGGRWADGSNVRFRNGKPQVIGGWTALFAGTLNSAVVGMTAFDVSGTAYAAYGTQTKIYIGALGGTVPSDLTPVGYSGGAAVSLSPYGSTLMVAPTNGKLYQWTLASGAVTHITQAPSQITCMLVTPERQVLAFGCNEEASATFNHRCIRGSDIEDPTNWTTSATNNVFEHIIEGDGKIVWAKQIGSYIAVWTDTALHLGQFIGDPNQTYRFDVVANNCGLIGPKAVTVIGQTAYWVGNDYKIWSWTPGGVPVALECPIHKDFRDNVDYLNRTKITAGSISQFNELWIFYPRTTSTNTHYIAVSTESGHWFRGEMARSAMMDSNLLTVALSGSDITATAMADTSGNVFIHEYENSANGSALTWHLTSADQYLNKTQQRMLVRGFLPDFEDQIGDISLTVNVRNRPQETATAKGPYTLTTATTKKDFRASGKIISMKFSGSATSTYFRGGEPLIDMVPLGER